MGKENRNTFRFIRSVHRIPAGQRLQWAVIEVPDGNNRLGVYLTGTDKYIDFSTGRFTQIHSGNHVHPATRKPCGDWYVYTPSDGDIPPLRLPKCFISDMYYTILYSKDMMDGYMP